MIRILIIEDEKPAFEKLRAAVLKFDAEISILPQIGSVREAVKFLGAHPAPDLLLLDIHLSDGISLEIFKQIPLHCPVIFTTAYDEYILEAFHYNSIDYLLKPIRQSRLDAALNKYLRLKAHFTREFQGLVASFEQPKKNRYRDRILVKKGIDFTAVPTAETAYFYTEHKLVFLIGPGGARYVVDRPLGELESELDPAQFFRLNRKYLASISSIRKFSASGKGKLKVELHPAVREDVIVSQEKAAAFRKWMDGD